MESATSTRPGAIAAATLVPIAAAAAVDPGGWYPFDVAKQGAVLCAVAAAAALAPGAPLPRRWLWVWSGLLAWLALAAVLGADRWYAWIGTPERRLGWLTWAMFAAAMWVGASLGDTGLRWWRRGVVVAGGWVAGYTVVELFLRAPIETSAVSARLGGPFGSAAYLGAACCLFVPIAAGVAADVGERVAWRIGAMVAVLGGLVAVLGSGTRAAWLALAVVAAVVTVACRPGRRSIVVGAVLLGLALVAVAGRLDEVSNRDGGGGASRVDEWAVAVRVVAGRPLTGAGPEGYRIVFAEGVTADYERSFGRAVLPDRAHSGPLDVAAIGGLPAAAGYCLLLAAVGRRAVRAVRSGDAARVGLGAAALAYLVQQLALFPLAELDPTFWIVAGALAVEHHQATPRWASRVPRAGRPPAATFAWAGAAVALFVVSVVGIAADRAARRAVSTGDRAAAARAADLRPDVIRYHLLEAALGEADQSVAGARAAVAATERAAAISPRDPLVRQAAAEALTGLAHVTGDATLAARAVAAWRDQVDDDPDCGSCWFGLARAALVADDPATAAGAQARAAALGRAQP